MGLDQHLRAAVGGRRGVAAADSLCQACVGVLDVDAAAISLIFDGAASGTLGCSSGSARVYDELQFTLGEGPCLDCVAHGVPILIADLAGAALVRWPAYGPAMLDHQMCGIFAIPVVLAGEHIGALDLFRGQPGELGTERLADAILAADLAAIRLLDIMSSDLQAAVNDPGSRPWAEFNSLSRVEVSQATGMLIADLEIEPAEALARLRAHAYATGRSATDVARDILARRLSLEAE